MLFNSIQFAVFFAIVYCLYLYLDYKWQNRMLLVASCIFYGAWDWRFLLLLFVTILIDYMCGLKIHGTCDVRKKKRYLWISILSNLAILGFFKYCNFFVSNLQILFAHIGLKIHPQFLGIVLPVGISFYTFQSMSYVIDVYRGQLKPATKLFDFALFVTFFPQLVAGPIERATHLLPQILSPRKFRANWFYQGLYLILWGLFQKVVVADNLAKIVNPIFSAPAPYNGAEVLIGVYAFAFQIFCDFSGYSDIARGLGKVMGFDIMINFNFPYFSTSPAEFWKRWHISLSQWLRDYLYIPLGGNRKGVVKTYRNLIVSMFLGGLWHGAAWTYVIWGIYHGFLLVVYRLANVILTRIVNGKNFVMGKGWIFIKGVVFFHLVCIGWLIFRAASIGRAMDMFYALFSNFNISGAAALIPIIKRFVTLTGVLLAVQSYQYVKNDLLALFKLKPAFRGIAFFIMFIALLYFGVREPVEFIYFQF